MGKNNKTVVVEIKQTLLRPIKKMADWLFNKIAYRVSAHLDHRFANLEQGRSSPERYCEHLHQMLELHYRDILLALMLTKSRQIPACRVRLETNNPLAIESHDHQYPRGTMNDNTRRPQFVSACERLMGSKLKHLDLGCAGGGLVLDFILRGHFSIGLEGSDYSYLRQRAEWRLLPCNLFTCDITKPFIIRDIDSDEQLTFHVISAWEFMEHIVEEDLPCVLQNVYDHLSTDGLFIGSIATFPEDDSHVGAIYHHTLKPLGWWEEFFGKHGLRFVYDHQFLSQDFVRGVGNGPMDWNAVTNPGMGFHFVARKLVLS